LRTYLRNNVKDRQESNRDSGGFLNDAAFSSFSDSYPRTAVNKMFVSTRKAGKTTRAITLAPIQIDNSLRKVLAD
jgi:hypothetical protein